MLDVFVKLMNISHRIRLRLAKIFMITFSINGVVSIIQIQLMRKLCSYALFSVVGKTSGGDTDQTPKIRGKAM